MKVEYQRDMQHNYLIIKDELPFDSTFQEKMLVYNQLEGFLPFHIQQMNGERMIYYEINAYQPLSEVCDKIPCHLPQLCKLSKSILKTISQAKEYLLKEDDFFISIDHMYVDLPEYNVHICYYAGYQKSIKKQLAKLFEAFMDCVDYEDREAVYLAYSLYMKSKDISCTIEDLMKIIEEQNISISQSSKLKITPDLEGDSTLANRTIMNSVSDTTTVNVGNQRSSQFPMDHKATKLENKSPEMKMESRERVSSGFSVTSNDPKSSIKGLPLAVEAAYYPPNQRVIENQTSYKKSVSSRPLISQSRQEEQEVHYYPSKYYIFGGIIVLAVTIFCVVIASGNLLRDSVSHKLLPTKLAAMLVVVLIPSIYGLVKIFNPKNKVSKVINIGLYEPVLHQETAAAVELDPLDHIRMTSNERYRNEGNEKKDYVNMMEMNHTKASQYSDDSVRMREHSYLKNEINSLLGVDNVEEGIDKSTILLNGVVASPFPQLISDKPEIADTITIMDCPFYIGTVKNRLNYSLTSPVISRYHAKIEKIDDAYFLRDLNSTNGTFLNGRRVDPEEPCVLVPGDKVAFANISFNFTCPNN